MNNQNIRKHRFYKVNKRGRLAYVILCFEEIIMRLNLQHEIWNEILRKMWGATSAFTIDDPWSLDMTSRFPDWILSYNSYEDALSAQMVENVSWFQLSLDEFNNLKQFYCLIGDKIDVISEAFHCVYDVLDVDMYREEPYSPESLPIIDRMETILIRNSIPLPNDEHAINFIMKQKGPSYGESFNGMSLSSYM